MGQSVGQDSRNVSGGQSLMIQHILHLTHYQLLLWCLS